MVEKRNITPRGTPPDGIFSWPMPEFEQLYNNTMDAAFAALGRDIVLHLPPERIVASGLLQANHPALQYNPFQGRSPRPSPSVVSTSREPAVHFVHRDVTYKAQIRHGPKDDDKEGGVRLDRDQVSITTLVESGPHIIAAESATIDGMRYERVNSRPIGLQQVRYIISTWKLINERENVV